MLGRTRQDKLSYDGINQVEQVLSFPELMGVQTQLGYMISFCPKGRYLPLFVPELVSPVVLEVRGTKITFRLPLLFVSD